MAHKGHPKCEFTSKAACESARREAMGRCSAMTEKMTDCTNWGVDHVNGKAYCGQHLASMALREDEARRQRERTAALDASVAAYLAATGQSAHDCGAVCYFSVLMQGPRLSDLDRPAATGPQPAP